MSVEVEEELTVVQPEEVSNTNVSMKPVRSYTREFLLSLSELESCKKLPKGFDESLLSEFHATPYSGAQDRPRVLGSSSLQGFRRTDYGSSPPVARGDSGTYSRGIQRWDSRSSGKSEGDSDSESGRRYGNQGRGTWKNSEQDGLLGSGSFPRPPVNAVSGVAQRFHPTENLQLNKSNEPYQPPRPYQAGPHPRRETKDSFNDETFGSSDCTDEERVEEEKKRRAEFELMRKEHHKAFQENQKSNSGRPKDSFSEMFGLMENNSDIKFSSDLNNVLKEAPQDDAGKLSVSSQTLPTRPLLPPGFVSGGVDKNSSSNSHLHAHALQVENLQVEQGHQNVNSKTQESGSSEWFGEMSNSSNLTKKGLSILHDVDLDDTGSSNLPVLTDVLEIGERLVLDSEITGLKIGEPVRSTSILDKLFDNGLTTTCENTSNIVEGDGTRGDDIWCPDRLQSKFTRWFHEEDKTTLGNASAEKPSSLLSLIIGGEESRSDGLNGVQKTSKTVSSIEVPERFDGNNGPLPKASVLTCEDLEQSILSEIGGDNPKFRSVQNEEHIPFEVRKDGLLGTHVDNSASQHLLFLLQSGTSSNCAVLTLGLAEGPPDDDKELGRSCLPESSKNSSGARELTHSDRTLTLESLFGTAFMTELNSGTSGGMDAPDGRIFPSIMGEIGDEVGSHEGGIFTSNDGIAKLDKVADGLDSKDNGKKEDLLRLPFEADAKFGGFDGGIGGKLPKEDSLINPINTDLRSLSLNTSGNVMEKFAALGGAVKDERSFVGGPEQLFFDNPCDTQKSDITYQNPHFNTPPMDNSRTLFHPVDSHSSHIDPLMKFLFPEAAYHDISLHHQFPTNMDRPSFPHTSTGLAPFDHLIPPPVLQQMRMAGNPPPHLARGFPGAASMAPHPSHTPSFISELNPMQVFPFGQRPPHFGGPRMMPQPGPEHGVANNPTDAFQRLLEVEMRANPKQMHPFAAGNSSRPMYGHELDMGYRYR